MVTDILIGKVREKVLAGEAEVTIKSSLLQEGWPLEDIDSVLEKEVRGGGKKKTSGALGIIIYTIIGIVIAGVLASGFWLWMDQKKKTDASSLNKWSMENAAEAVVSQSPTSTPATQRVEINQPKLLPGQYYLSKKDGFEIIAPPGWTKDETGEMGGSVTFFGPEATESGVIYKANLVVMVGPAGGNTLTSYQAFFVTQEAKVMPAFNIIDQKIITVSGRKVYLVRASFVQEDLLLNTRVILIVENDKVYLATAMFLDKEWESLNKLIDESLISLNPIL